MTYTLPSTRATGLRRLPPLPLVVDFHGYSEGAAIHAATTMLGAMGDAHGLHHDHAAGARGGAELDGRRGLARRRVRRRPCSTRSSRRCASTPTACSRPGYSYGAFMISAVACTYADRIAAIAPVAGIRNPKGCKPTRPVPVVAFHGTKDPFIAYHGGFGPASACAPESRRIGEDDRRDRDSRADRGGVEGHRDPGDHRGVGEAQRLLQAPEADQGRRRRDPHPRTACPKDATVELYRVTDGGHSWPGSQFSKSIESVVGKTTFSISANDIIWKFFEKHPLTKS